MAEVEEEAVERRQIPLSILGRLTDVEQFENVILRTDQEGAAIVRLGDVGRAEEGLQNYWPNNPWYSSLYNSGYVYYPALDVTSGTGTGTMVITNLSNNNNNNNCQLGPSLEAQW